MTGIGRFRSVAPPPPTDFLANVCFSKTRTHTFDPNPSFAFLESRHWSVTLSA